MVKRTIRHHYQDKLQRDTGDLKKTWKTINMNKSKKDTKISELRTDDNETIDLSQIPNAFNSFSAGPYKRRTCRIYGTVYDFADSYLRFGACYVDENATIRFSETISPNSYR